MKSRVAFALQSARRTAVALMFPVALLVLAGCDQKAAENVEASPDFVAIAGHHELMEWVLDPAADVIWDSAGFIITVEGEEDLSPTEAAGWENVVRNATVLAESSNLLMMPGHSAGADWDEFAVALRGTSQLAIAAAQAQDADALFDAGGQIYQVCRACHEQYWVQAAD